MKCRLLINLLLGLLLAAFVHGESGPVPLPPAPLRPGAELGPTKISVVAWLADVLKIDSAGQTFFANLVLVLRWHDPRLAHEETQTKTYPLADVWHPRWLIANEADSVRRSLPETLDVAPDGSVVYRQRLVGSFSKPLNLHRFPFDHDTFRVQLVALGYNQDEIEFVPDHMAVASGLKGGVGIAPELTLQDWQVTSVAAHPQPYLVLPGVEIAGYAIEFSADRRVKHYLLKVFLPLLLIVLMSWTVFWIDPSNGGSQISVAVTSILTLIAYRFAIGADVPRLPYLTRLDAFILISSILVFCSLIEVMVTTKLADQHRLEFARKIDCHCRWLFPCVFTVLTAVIFLR